MYVKRVHEALGDRMTMKELADAFGMSTYSIYKDMERDIPEELSNMNANRGIKLIADESEGK